MSGRLVLMGSGETSPSLVATHRRALVAAGADAVTILDSPFGFQENADELTRRLGRFFESSLGVRVLVAGLRRPAAPPAAVERMLAAVRRSRAVFAGPGSPSYALRVWQGTGIADALADVVAAGGTVTLASAAALTAGSRTIPVYEIYKVGEDPFWLEGLDLTGRLGIPLTVVPHWNNTEGGTHDTSRCFIGRRRFEELRRDLATPILGIDEHTAATLDFDAGTLDVSGVGAATLLGDAEIVVPAGETVPLPVLRPPLPAPPPAAEAGEGSLLDRLLALEEAARTDAASRRELRAALAEVADAAAEAEARRRGLLDAVVAARDRARAAGRFTEADLLRDLLAAAGYGVRDTPDGVEITG